jgi:hypothetical protein
VLQNTSLENFCYASLLSLNISLTTCTSALLAMNGEYRQMLFSPNTGIGYWAFLTVASHSLHYLTHMVTLDDSQLWALGITLTISNFLPQKFYA